MTKPAIPAPQRPIASQAYQVGVPAPETDTLTWLQRPTQASTLHIVAMGWSAPPAAVGQWPKDAAVVTIANPVSDDWVTPTVTAAKDYDNCVISMWSLGFVAATRRLGDISNSLWWGMNGVIDPFTGALDRTQSEAMAAALTPARLTAFQRGLCGSKARLHQWLALPGHPSLDRAQASLAYLVSLADESSMVAPTALQRVVISAHDRIMNTEAMTQTWQTVNPQVVQHISEHHWVPDFLDRFAPRGEPKREQGPGC